MGSWLRCERSATVRPTVFRLKAPLEKGWAYCQYLPAEFTEPDFGHGTFSPPIHASQLTRTSGSRIANGVLSLN